MSASTAASTENLRMIISQKSNGLSHLDRMTPRPTCISIDLRFLNIENANSANATDAGNNIRNMGLSKRNLMSCRLN